MAFLASLFQSLSSYSPNSKNTAVLVRAPKVEGAKALALAARAMTASDLNCSF